MLILTSSFMMSRSINADFDFFLYDAYVSFN